jgi:hypothetical protein
MGLRHNPIAAICGLAMAMAHSGDAPKRDRTCRYRTPAGPPHPTSRQQRRALFRQASAALARLSAPNPKDQPQ